MLNIYVITILPTLDLVSNDFAWIHILKKLCHVNVDFFTWYFAEIILVLLIASGAQHDPKDEN